MCCVCVCCVCVCLISFADATDTRALDEGSRRACMVSFGPQFASPANALTEILFVLDLSSSMGSAEVKMHDVHVSRNDRR